jgi:methylmalonyl-CoA mutase
MTLVNETPVAPADAALAGALAQWKKTVEAELKGAAYDQKLVTRTFEGVTLQPLYTRADLAGLPDLAQRPGEAPFLRGVRPLGYKERPWEVAQVIAERSPQAFNTALLADLMHGQDSVVLPAGPDGPVIERLADLRSALAGVDLAAVPVHVAAGADALPLAALHLAHAQERGTAWEKLTGSVAADPLDAWVATGRLAGGYGARLDSLAAWTGWAARHAPRLQTIGVNGARWGDAGGTAVQQLAFALAAATEYLRVLTPRGVKPDAVVARMRFQFAVGPQFFTEVAKFRAWRLLWARVLAGFATGETPTARATVHAATGRWNQTLLDAHVNLLRVTTEALSAVLGGCDSLHIAPFDEVTGATDDFSRRIARNVHTILAEEFSFTQTADPAGGSWYVEKLTDDLARQAWALFQDLEGRGGFAAALREGHPQKLVAAAAAARTDAVGKRRLGLVGTNLFPNLKEQPLTMRPAAVSAPPPPAAKAGPILEELPVGTDWPGRFEAAIAAARAWAGASQLARLLPPAAATEPDIPLVAPWRAAAGFENLRAASAACAQRTGRKPRVFLAKIGPLAQHKARADFAAGFFATAGFEVMAKQSFETAEAAAVAAGASGASVAVLCSSDDTYPALVPVFASAAKGAALGDLTVVLAGLPADPALVASYRAAGVDEFIHLRANAHDLLAKLLKQIGALA